MYELINDHLKLKLMTVLDEYLTCSKIIEILDEYEMEEIEDFISEMSMLHITANLARSLQLRNYYKDQ